MMNILCKEEKKNLHYCDSDNGKWVEWQKATVCRRIGNPFSDFLPLLKILSCSVKCQ